MASIYVTEFANLGEEGKGGNSQAGQMPPVAVQVVPSGSPSQPFNERTRFVLISSTQNQHIAFGDSPSATSNDTLILPGERYFGVYKGHRVANLDSIV